MRKLIICLITILCMLFLSSCSMGGSRVGMLNGGSDEKKAAAKLEQVIEAIKIKDKDSLKSLFSQRALSEAVSFGDNIDGLFDFIQGEVDSWEKSSGPSVSEESNYGHVKKEVNSYYYVNTDKQKYFFLLQDYPVYTDHPDNVGLYLFLVVKAEDREKIYDGDEKILYDGDKKLSPAGIYLPIK